MGETWRLVATTKQHRKLLATASSFYKVAKVETDKMEFEIMNELKNVKHLAVDYETDEYKVDIGYGYVQGYISFLLDGYISFEAAYYASLEENEAENKIKKLKIIELDFRETRNFKTDDEGFKLGLTKDDIKKVRKMIIKEIHITYREFLKQHSQS